MSIKKFIRTIFHPNTIKIVSLIFIVGFFFVLPTYAQNVQNDGLGDIQSLLEKFLSLCSRGWIVLAILAGKMMTNDFVYGAFMHMDIYLWKIRNIMKNFANFALVGLVLFSIVESLTGKALDVKKIITNTLVAGILIQASWFLMGAVIDISTVATAGIGAFPTAFLKSDPVLQDKIKTSIGNFKFDRPIINFNSTGNNMVHTIRDITTNTQSNEELRDNILPSYNSVSGPFIYLGMGVFNFQNYLTTENTTAAIPLTLGFALRFFLLASFTIGLLLLLIANIMRIGLLWIFIIGSPFLVLSQVFNVGKGGSGGLGKLFSLSNLVAIVFKPVIFVAGISMMLIVIVSMQKSITGSGATWESNLNGVTLGMSGTSTSTLAIEGISNIAVNQNDILGKDVVNQGQNFFSQLIMLLLTIFIMWRFVKLSLTIGGGPIEKTMEKLTGLAENFAKSAPMLPGGLSFSATKNIMDQNKKKTMEGLGMDKYGNFGQLDAKGQNFQTNQDKFSQFINNKLDLQAPWTGNDWSELNSLATGDQYQTFFTRSQELAKDREGGVSLSKNTDRTNALNLLLSDESRAKTLGFAGPLVGKATEDQLKTYFTTQKNREALYDAMGGQAASGVVTPTDYDRLKNITFHASKES